MGTKSDIGSNIHFPKLNCLNGISFQILIIFLIWYSIYADQMQLDSWNPLNWKSIERFYPMKFRPVSIWVEFDCLVNLVLHRILEEDRGIPISVQKFFWCFAAFTKSFLTAAVNKFI